MKYPVSYKDFTPNLEYYDEVIKNHSEASSYLLSFKWCNHIKDCKLYLNIGSKISIFLFEIENNASSDDNLLWLIVGDIPPVYLDIYGATTTVEVLNAYVELAEDWISHVRNGDSIIDCYPFDAKPTIEMAELLNKRASFIKKTLVKNIEDIPLLIN